VDFARRTTAFYEDIASESGFSVAPVPQDWVAAGNPDLYAPDGHHASAAGAAFAAATLWAHIKVHLP
jgi:lysophospholipase L1-like esterase